MNLYTIIALAFGLAMDAFAVSISAGLVLPRLSFRAVFRLSWHFGLFQFMMPVCGWLAGISVQNWVTAYDKWIAFALLGFIGGKMIYESLDRESAQKSRDDPTRGLKMIMLSVATSIDAFAAGLTMAMLKVEVWFPSVIIGLVAGGMSVLGMFLGRRLGRLFGRRMELVGGLILIGIGIHILFNTPGITTATT